MTRRTVCVAVDDSAISDGCAAWVGKNVLTTNDCVHLVLCVPPTPDPTITMGAWEEDLLMPPQHECPAPNEGMFRQYEYEPILYGPVY